MNRGVFYQEGFDVRFEWGEEGVRQLAPKSDILVIIDVLSFTTCVEVAIERIATVFPYRFRDETARHFATSVNALLANGQDSVYSLSPSSMAKLHPETRIVLPSPNGATCSIVASELGSKVIAGCLRNAAAVAKYINSQSGVVSIIACGERWSNGSLRPSIEDMIGAGAILSHLHEFKLSPEAYSAIALYLNAKSNLESVLLNCISGRELNEKGYRDSVTIASKLNVSNVVPVLTNGAYLNYQ